MKSVPLIIHGSDRTTRPFLVLGTENSKVSVGAMDEVNPHQWNLKEML